jgi:hypothetical protein
LAKTEKVSMSKAYIHPASGIIKMIGIVLLPIFLSACALGYRIDPLSLSRLPECIVDNAKPEFKTKEECERSQDYQNQVAEYKSGESFRIYDHGLEMDGRFYCSESRYSYVKPVNEKPFSTEAECKSSPEFKLVVKNHKAKIKASLEKANSMRLGLIDEYVSANPNSSTYKQLSVQKKIAIGMPEELVYLSWGKPNKVNTTVTRTGSRKQLVYGRSYVYIENGTVTAWQN